MIITLITIFIAYVIADFIMGIYHWIKDTYFSPFTPIIGKLFIWGSRLHHIRPRYVLEFSNTELFLSSAKWTLIWMLPLFYIYGISVFLFTLFLTICINDIVHKYSHMKDNERPLFVTILQRAMIIQSHEEHHQHHISPHDINYCPVSPYVNFVLERLNFWRKLENLILNYTGIPPRAKEYEFIENPNFAAGIEFID